MELAYDFMDILMYSICSRGILSSQTAHLADQDVHQAITFFSAQGKASLSGCPNCQNRV
jgi:hypothetical protein